MRKTNIIRHFSMAIGGFVLLVAFNNCDKGFMMTDDLAGLGSLSAGEFCEDNLLKVYESTYHGFLSSSCNNCHIVGPGIGKFASPNVKTSFASFSSVGADKINTQAVSETHKPPYTGAANTARIEDYKVRWAAAQQNYATCLNQNGGTPVNNSGEVLRTTNVSVPANLGTTFTRLEWNLEDQQDNKLPLIAGIEIRRAVLNNVTQGYEFRNPTLRLRTAAAGAHYARALNLYINRNLQTNVTTYSNIQATVTTTTDMQIAAGYSNAWAVMSAVSNNDVIGLEFSVLKSTTATSPTPSPSPTVTVTPSPSPSPSPTTTVTPTVVTYSQLVATGGVFATQCLGCHNNTRSDGGLSLATYASARTAAANIRSRINNAANPMPLGALMNQTMRNTVNAWVDGGAPQ